MSEYSSYPLHWPEGVPRHRGLRESGTFKGSPGAVRDDMLDEIDRLLHTPRGHSWRTLVILSSNLRLRNDGLPAVGQGEPADPGIAVYFPRNGTQVCFSCDKYDRTWKNMRAIHKTIEAMRGIERWGSKELLDRAFTGFATLPAPGQGTGSNAWKVLGIAPMSGSEVIEKAFRAKAMSAHPDKGGSADDWHTLQSARADALAQIK